MINIDALWLRKNLRSCVIGIYLLLLLKVLLQIGKCALYRYLTLLLLLKLHLCILSLNLTFAHFKI